MGSQIAAGALRGDITARDGDNEVFSPIDLMQNGNVVQMWRPALARPELTHALEGRPDDYLYVRVFSTGSTSTMGCHFFSDLPHRQLI
jgi:hypothetical protein